MCYRLASPNHQRLPMSRAIRHQRVILTVFSTGVNLQLLENFDKVFINVLAQNMLSIRCLA